MDFLKIVKNKFFLVGIGVIVITMALFCFEAYPKNKIAIGVKIAGINMSGKTEKEAQERLKKEIKNLLEKTISFSLEDEDGEKKEKMINVKDLGMKYDIKKDAKTAFSVGKNKGFFGNLREKTLSLVGQSKLPLRINVNEDNLDNVLAKEFGQFETLPQNAQVNFNEKKNTFEVKESKTGEGFSRLKIQKAIEKNISNLKTEEICLSLKGKTKEDKNNCFFIEVKKPEIKTNMAEGAKDEANTILEKAPYYLSANGKTEKVTTGTVGNWFLFVPKTKNKKNVLTPSLDEELVKSYLAELSQEVNIEPQNPTLSFQNGKIKITSSPRTGKTINVEKSMKKIQEKLLAEENKISLVIDVKKPDITQEKIRTLKIEKLLAKGTSNFSGSPNNRKHNIDVGASKFNGILIAPGEIFSFNDTLGNVGPKEGYLPELVIKENKTVPEYGGGICQVSTTVFRAAVYTGLEVIERYAHAFPVRYYDPQGFDATVYQPSPDLRFKNNTPSYILVQTKIQGNILVFEFYGKDDGRKVKVKGPYQYAIKKSGAMKARLTQEVWKKGKLIYKRTFFSSYDSPKKYPTSR